MEKKKVIIYTDGACLGNPGPGGYGAILEYKGTRREISGGEEQTTNNRMELSGVIAALSELKGHCEVDIYTDSRYIVDAVNKDWARRWKRMGWMRNKKEPALNHDLWEKLLSLLDMHDANLFWVKGHADNPHNNRCDELAVAEAKKRKFK